MFHLVLRHWCALARALFITAVLLGPTIAVAHDGVAGQIAALSIQIAKDADNAELFLRRADLYRVARQWKDALSDLDRAEQLDPSLPTIDLVRCQALLGQTKYRAANHAATRFLNGNPQHLQALIVRARARAALDFRPEAIADFTSALELRPLPELYLERARASATDTLGLQSAIRGLDEGIARLGSIVSLELEAISYEVRLRSFDQALSRIDRIASHSPRQEMWLARRGEILEQAGRSGDARLAYEAALAATTTLPAAKQKTRATSLLITRLRADIARLQSDRQRGQKQGQ